MTDFFGDLDYPRPVREEDKVERRGRWNTPWVMLPDGSGKAPYTRFTTFAGALEGSTYNLSLHHQRCVAEGLARRPDLLMEYALTLLDTETDPKLIKQRRNRLASMAQHAATDELTYVIQAMRHVIELRDEQNAIVDAAREAGGDGIKANVGTNLHTYADRHDLGLEMGFIQPQWEDAVKAYIEITADMVMVEIETFLVNDHFRTAGTPDRLAKYAKQPCPYCDSTLYVADIKSGKTEWSGPKFGRQLALGAVSTPYKAALETTPPWFGRRERPKLPCLHRGIIIHISADTGEGQLQWVDIGKGIETLNDCHRQREQEKYKWLSPVLP